MKEKSSNGSLSVTLFGHSSIDFNRAIVNKGVRRAGNDVRNEARRLLARNAISKAGEFPGKQSGRLQRSIQILGAGNGWIRVGPKRTSGMKVFYPAFLYYGVTGKPRRKDHRAQFKDGGSRQGWRISPRGNYMTAALANKRERCREIIRNALFDALKPR